jgi:cyclophilin family peptidyl-prolyl cis-trans isomerase
MRRQDGAPDCLFVYIAPCFDSEYTSGRSQQMRRLMALALVALVMLGAGNLYAKDNPVVVLETTEGKITVELYPDKAPITVDNFLWYVDNKFFDGLIFHRVMKNFMIQGGGYTAEMRKKATNPAIENEAGNGLTNDKYTIAMARTPAVHSATAQFFINTKDNISLNHKDTTARGFGYCVFGKVIDGKDAVDAIEGTPVGSKNGMENVPKSPVVIKAAYQIDKDGKKIEKKKK